MDLDDAMNDIDELEERDSAGTATQDEGKPIEDIGGEGKELIGTVEKYFSRIGVAAVRLTGHLRVGDTIEISGEEVKLREVVSSMQINRKDVDEAFAGDDVGVKLANPVPEDSRVYRLPNVQEDL